MLDIPVYVADQLPEPSGSPRRIPLVETLLVQAGLSAESSQDTARIKLVESLDDARFCVIPYYWTTYQTAGLTSQIRQLAAQHPDKHLIIWSFGDLESIIPIRNAMQFQNGLHRSVNRLPEHAFELPAFWPDYLAIYCDGQQRPRKKQIKPSIGFCGQASSPAHKLAYFTTRNITHAAGHRLGLTQTVAPPVRPPVLLRQQALRALSNSDRVQCNFVIRDRYRAGVRSKEERNDPFHPTKVEFVNNILDNDYTVCVRGGGNFSVRLYETLSLGRIPIFIDTDSRLPYDFVLDWKEYCVWVEQIDALARSVPVSILHYGNGPDALAEAQAAAFQFLESRHPREG